MYGINIGLGNATQMRWPSPDWSTAGRSTTIYLFLPPAVAFENALTSYFFTSDPQGSKRVSEPELETYCITVEHTVGEKVFPNLCTPKAMMARRYRFLREIHQECGFNAHSTQAAVSLGLPLFQLHGIDSEKVKDMCCDIEGVLSRMIIRESRFLTTSMENIGEVAQLSSSLTAWNVMIVMMTVVILFSVRTFMSGVV
ncbi:hypothetical protein EV421DRAFT_2018049 [Armillaria borealis]|uniref:Uncharacterized protein n=1 Tax=Armillaria borealis TaxID=47425 RepID=A0AA39JQ45_9AGAR|nr:hypothetical protein EV421DRAFT_2018049 [Armillaria borealis]